MPAHKIGPKLSPGQHWSVKYPGCVDCGSGTFRRPVEYRKSWTNYYYVEKQCTGCGIDMLQSRANHARGSSAFCSNGCRSSFIRGSNVGKEYKKPREHGMGFHILIKDPTHHRAGKRNGCVFQHILVAEDSLGRRIEKSERVHHINAIKSDNRPENLFVCASDKEHFLIHGSLNSCISSLIDAGLLEFDRESRRYVTTALSRLAGKEAA